MKKLAMLFMMAATTSIVGAAQFDWKLQTGLDYVGQSVYAIKGCSSAGVLAVLQGTDADAWVTTFSGLEGYAVTGSNARAGAQGGSFEISANDNLVFVIVKGEITEGSTYTVLRDYSIPAANVYDPPATVDRPTILLTNVGIAGSGTFVGGSEPTPEPIPEPTSGILLLIGMAGLTLKRKRI